MAIYSNNDSDSEMSNFLLLAEEVDKYDTSYSNQKLELLVNTTPHHVSYTKNPKDETKEQMENVQEIFLRLPESIQDKLVSYVTAQKIQAIGQEFNLELLQMADVSRAIRSYYFGEIQLADLPQILSREIGIDLAKAKMIADSVIQNIINNDFSEKQAQIETEKMNISDAMKRYPEIGEQLITANKISLKSFPEPVRPSIKNWISDYMFNVGINNRDQMVRTDYLFRNINTVRLSADEREKLTQIVKSFDENTPVAVDPKRKQVVFEKATSDMRPASAKAMAGDAGDARNISASNNFSIRPTAPKKEDEYVADRLSNWRKDLEQATSGKRQETRGSEQKTASSEQDTKYPASAQASAWQGRIPDTKYDIPNTNVSFSSPQKLPIEKKAEPIVPPQQQPQPQPRKVYSNPPVDLSNISLASNNPTPSSKNVVNLKEN